MDITSAFRLAPNLSVDGETLKAKIQEANTQLRGIRHLARHDIT
jgi:hypothetical protein